MTRKEAIKNLKDILEEATETDDSVCYVTADDADALKMAINSLEIDERYELEYEQAEQKTDVFDKIRAEILNFKEKCNASDYLGCGILEIIDKYKAESEERE